MQEEHTDNILTRREFALRYMPGDQYAARNLIAALSPIWLCWSIFSLCRLLCTATSQQTLFVITSVFFYTILLIAGALSMAVALDARLRLSAAGVRFPLRYYKILGGRLFRSWNELTAVDLRDYTGHTEARTINLIYGEARVEVSVAGLSSHGLRSLVYALMREAPSAVDVSALAASFDIAALPELARTQTETSGFTRDWEAQLAERFGTTTFVPLTPGTTIGGGRIEITGQLAFGGMSAVYIGRQSGVDVVVKEAVLPLGASSEAALKAASMFEREAELLSKLEHPRVARVLDYFRENGRHYLIIERIAFGVDLRRYLASHGAQPEAVALRWSAEIARILQYLHELSPPMVHRDITPDNIVMDEQGRLNLVDFGAANNFLGTATGTIVGKQSYIAPEQLRGKATPASDLYALACTTVCVLTGRDPEPLTQVDPASLPCGLSSEFAAILTALTSQNESERGYDSAALVSALDSLKQKSGVGHV